MSNQLPPSPYGAGYTYGGPPGQQQPPRQQYQQSPGPYGPDPGYGPTTAYPTYSEGHDPYAQGPDPYAHAVWAAGEPVPPTGGRLSISRTSRPAHAAFLRRRGRDVRRDSCDPGWD